MKIAYLDCSMGISGDMTLAALVDAGVDRAAVERGVASMGLPGVRFVWSTVMRAGFRGLHVRIEHPEQHAHRGLPEITRLIHSAADITPSQKRLALKIFTAVAEAEAKVHGSTIDQVHFHEVGAIDSICDIVGTAIGFDLLGVDRIECSPIPTGRGTVRIAHGVCPIPTPGTAELLRGIPIVDIPVDFELTTPTGAAIVRSVATAFGPRPAMTLEHIGCGAGTMQFPDRSNLLRLFVGKATAGVSSASDTVVVLETNLDDVAPEVIGYTSQRLFEAGALDVFNSPIQMKKSRPGVLLTVIARPTDRDHLEAILFEETNTFGIRRTTCERSKLLRRSHTVSTDLGEVVGKLGWVPGGTPIFVPEYESCASAAAETGVPLRDVYHAAKAAFAATPVDPATLTVQSTVELPETHRHDHDHDQHHDHDHRHDHDHDHRHDEHD